MKLTLIALALAATAWANPVITVDNDTNLGCATVLGGTISTGLVGVDTTNLTASVYARVGAFTFPPFGPPPSGTGCTVTLTADLQTPGPIRNGFLEYEVTGGAYRGYAYLDIDDTFRRGCGTYLCFSPMGTVPFTLGVPFSLTALAYANLFLGGGGGELGEAGMQTLLRFYELTDEPSPTKVYSVVTFAPEPATWLLAGLGLIGLAWRRLQIHGGSV